MTRTSLLIIVTGYPATGKTTLARQLATKLHLALISKDDLKEGIAEEITATNREESRRIGRATYYAMDRVIETCLMSGSSFIIESNFQAEFYSKKLQILQRKYNFRSVQILCKSTPDAIMERVSRRIAEGKRHQVHNEQEDIDSGIYRKSIGNGRIEPLDINGELVELDTTDFAVVDIDTLAAQVGRGQ